MFFHVCNWRFVLLLLCLQNKTQNFLYNLGRWIAVQCSVQHRGSWMLVLAFQRAPNDLQLWTGRQNSTNLPMMCTAKLENEIGIRWKSRTRGLDSDIRVDGFVLQTVWVKQLSKYRLYGQLAQGHSDWFKFPRHMLTFVVVYSSSINCSLDQLVWYGLRTAVLLY